MLSRLALRNAEIVPLLARGIQSTSSSTVPRPVRPEFPAPVRHGFIPEEWFTFFYPKTGVTGPYMFVTGVSTYLVSKEFYVLDHEYYNGLSFLIIWIYLVKKFGPQVAEYLDNEVDAYEREWTMGRENTIAQCKAGIEHEKNEQLRSEVQQIIIDAKKENIKMLLEATYRERIARVYNEVKKRLDYQVQIEHIERAIAQKHMAQWIIKNVLKSITPDQEKATLNRCISDLEALAKTA